jgi:HEAT repeat protein
VDEAEASRRLADSALPLEARIQAAAELGRPESSDAAFDAVARVAGERTEPLDLRVAAARAIGDMGRRRRSLSVLVGYIGEPARYRREGIAAMKKLGRVHESSEASLQEDLDAVAHDLESYRLGNLGHWGRDPRVLEVCLRAVGDPRPRVRMSALGSLATMGELGPVIEAVSDENVEVRGYATGLLGNLGLGDDKVQVEALRGRLADAEPKVRDAAKRALRLLDVMERAKPPDRARVKLPLVDATYDWPSILEKFSHALVRDPYYSLELPDDVVESGWLGYPGAGEDEISAAEQRLGFKFPPSYKSFLMTSNGFRHAGVRDLFHVEQVAYVEELMPGVIGEASYEVPDEEYFVYGPEQDPVNMRYVYLPRCIALSSNYDGEMYLLNPAVTFGEECEAWLLSHRLPGANRYRSFWDLMEEQSRTQTSPP